MDEKYEYVPVAIVMDQRWLDGKSTMEPVWIDDTLRMDGGSILYKKVRISEGEKNEDQS